MATEPPVKLPKYVRVSHGAYYHVRWNPSTKRVVWTRLGAAYSDMLRKLADLEDDRRVDMSVVLERYRKEVSDTQASNTRRQRDWQINNLKAKFGGIRPAEVSMKHAYRYHAGRSKTAPVGANREITLLRNVMRHAIKWGYIQVNPIQDFIKNKEQPRDRYVTDAEFERVKAVAPVKIRLGMDLAYLTGQRITDILTLKWSQITPEGILFVQGKTGKKLLMAVTPALQAVLDECRGHEIYVLASGAHRITYDGFRMAFDTAKRKAGVEWFTMHDLRAKAATDSDGALLGHSDKRTLHRVYKRLPTKVSPVK